MSQLLSPLAAELREELRYLGPATGLEAWYQIARRIAIASRQDKPESREAMTIDLGRVKVIGRDAEGLPLIARADLDAALIECERAGALRCQSVERSGAEEVYEWTPIAKPPPAKRQATLFD